MQNFSGGFNSSFTPGMISTSSISTSNETSNETSTPLSSVSSNMNTSLPNKDEEEIKYMMKSMESLRLRNPDQFATVLINNKQILDMLTDDKVKTKEDMAIFENLFREVEDIDIDYLYWSAHKSIRKVAIEFKDIKLIHFFLIKKRYKLTNKQIYHNFLNDFMTSLKHLNFIEETNNDIYLYVSMFQMFINQGDADVNDSMNEMKNTPLHYAVIYNQFQLLLLLLKHNSIDVNPLNINGNTPLDIALKNIMIKDNTELNEEICIILTKHKGTPNTMKSYFSEIFTTNQKEEEEAHQ